MITKGSFLVQPSLSRSRWPTLAFSLHLTLALPSPLALRLRRLTGCRGGCTVCQILWWWRRRRVVKLAKAEKGLMLLFFFGATRHPNADFHTSTSFSSFHKVLGSAVQIDRSWPSVRSAHCSLPLVSIHFVDVAPSFPQEHGVSRRI